MWIFNSFNFIACCIKTSFFFNIYELYCFQFIPDTVVLTTLYGRLKISNLPLTALIISIFLWLIGILRGSVSIQIAFGLQISWTYLRFFRVSKIGLPDKTNSVNEDVYITGDKSEHFVWAR